MTSRDKDKIWYAAKETRIVLAPRKLLETFGQTAIRYYVLSDLLDSVGEVRIRKGKVVAERPQVITPSYFANQALENFGDEARQYAERLLNSVDGLRILQYGLHFRKEEHGEEVVRGEINEMADQVSQEVGGRDDSVYGVIIGVDDLWEVSLFKFTAEVVRESIPHNVRDLSSRGLLDASSGSVPNAVRIEIESDFRAAEGDRERLQLLGRKLRRYGLFQEYEDRFYNLLRRA